MLSILKCVNNYAIAFETEVFVMLWHTVLCDYIRSVCNYIMFCLYSTAACATEIFKLATRYSAVLLHF